MGLMKSFRRYTYVLATLLIVTPATACAPGGKEQPVVAAKSIEAVLESHNASLMAIPGVVGTAIGLCDTTPCIRVFLATDDAAARRRIPEKLEGHPVKVEVTGPIRAR